VAARTARSAPTWTGALMGYESRPTLTGGGRRVDQLERRDDAGRGRSGESMTTAVVVGSGPNGLAAALTLAAEGVDVTRPRGRGDPGRRHSQQRADAPRPDPRRVLGRAPTRRRHPVQPALRPRGARADVALARGAVRPPARRRRRGRCVPVGRRDGGPARHETVGGGERCSVRSPSVRRHHRRLPAPDAARARAPDRAARFGLYSGMPAALLARRLVTNEGRGAVRRRGRARLSPVRCADVLGDRGRPWHGGAPVRLAGR
jgi:hypothetical protein